MELSTAPVGTVGTGTAPVTGTGTLDMSTNTTVTRYTPLDVVLDASGSFGNHAEEMLEKLTRKFSTLKEKESKYSVQFMVRVLAFSNDVQELVPRCTVDQAIKHLESAKITIKRGGTHPEAAIIDALDAVSAAKKQWKREKLSFGVGGAAIISDGFVGSSLSNQLIARLRNCNVRPEKTGDEVRDPRVFAFGVPCMKGYYGEGKNIDIDELSLLGGGNAFDCTQAFGADGINDSDFDLMIDLIIEMSSDVDENRSATTFRSWNLSHGRRFGDGAFRLAC